MLYQYVTGKPKQVMEHYLLTGTEYAYQKARSVLQERYGNCNVSIAAFINKLEKWPKIGPKDTSAFREFSDLLDKVLAAKNNIPGLSVLDYAKGNVKLPSKLPYYLENKWRCTQLNNGGKPMVKPVTLTFLSLRISSEKLQKRQTSQS